MFPQSKFDAYMGKHGATVPSVRMITLFWPARQFHSAKCSSPLSSWTKPGIPAIRFAISPLVPVPSPFQPRCFRSLPLAMRIKALISCSRCTEFTIWYPALFFSMIQSTRESIFGPIFRADVGGIVAEMFEMLILLQHWSLVDMVVGSYVVFTRVLGDLPHVLGIVPANVDVKENHVAIHVLLLHQIFDVLA